MNSHQTLKAAYHQFHQAIGEHESWLTNSAKCRDLQNQLQIFNPTHTAAPDHIDDVIKTIAKGYFLVKSALQWHNPTVGNKGITPTPTDQARGIQWQLVMAYSGFETVVKILMNEGSNKGLDQPLIQTFINQCNPAAYIELSPPNLTLVSLDEWLSRPPDRNGDSQLLDFLSVQRGDRARIESWLVNATPITDWYGAVTLAKALRNTSAHGALSATKVREWGLKDAMKTLTSNLGELVAMSLKRLSEVTGQP